jgi:type II secretion system protein J
MPVRKQAPNSSHAKGFTLLEVIVAVGLSAFLLLIVYTTYFGINRTIDAASEEQEILESGRTFLDLIKQDLRGAISSRGYPFRSEVMDSDSDQSYSTLEFVTASSINTQLPGLSKVAYVLMASPQGEKAMVRIETKDTRTDLRKTGTAFEVSRMIVSFRLSFYDGTGWVEDWDSGTDGILPKQVKISVDVKDEKGHSRTFTSAEGIPGAP